MAQLSHDLHAALRAIHGGDLCSPCLWVLPVSGVAVTAVTDPINSRTFSATDSVAARLDEIQLDLGEGPCWQAFSTARPVLIPDLRRCPADLWPVFADAVRPTVARSLFVFPLLVGRTRVGVLSLYRTVPGALGPAGVDTACALAGTVARELATRLLEPAPTRLAALSELEGTMDRSLVYIATGVTMVQLNLAAPAAFARLQAHAFAAGSTVADVAGQVINHRLQLPS